MIYHILFCILGFGIGWGARGLELYAKMLKCKHCGWKTFTPLAQCPWCGSTKGFVMKVKR